MKKPKHKNWLFLPSDIKKFLLTKGEKAESSSGSILLYYPENLWINVSPKGTVTAHVRIETRSGEREKEYCAGGQARTLEGMYRLVCGYKKYVNRKRHPGKPFVSEREFYGRD